MANYYFNKSYLNWIFGIWLIFIPICTAGIIIADVKDRDIFVPCYWFVMAFVWIVYYSKYVKAVYQNIPALVISNKSIQVFQLNQTFLWEDIAHYRFHEDMRYVVTTITLELNNPKQYIDNIKNPVSRYANRAVFFIFKKKSVTINLQMLDQKGRDILADLETFDLQSQALA
jgi:hypothetical protein